ncbi:MAG: prolyl oligopeptidase family serine peptidase [Phycisphaerales bacterium]
MLRRSLVVLSCLTLPAMAALAAPPETQARPVTEKINGVELTDPYRWLEGDNSDPDKMGAVTPEVAAWTDAENAYTRSILDNLPGRRALEARLRELMEVGSVSAPRMAGTRYFYTKREGAQAQPIVYVREAYDAEPRVLLDPNTIDESGLTTISWFEPNQDGSLLAFGMYASGDENSTLYVMDVDTGEWLADEIPGKVNIAGWDPDSSGFLYQRLEDVTNPYSSALKHHVLGTHHRQDETLFRQQDIDFFYADSVSAERKAQLKTTWGPGGQPSEDGRWLEVAYWTSTADMDLWIADLDKWRRTGELKLIPAAIGRSGTIGSAHFVGDTLIAQTTYGAPKGRVVAIDLNDPGIAHWVDLVPEHESQVIEGVAFPRGRLAVQYMDRAATRIAQFDLHGKSLGDLELPGIGSGSLAADDDRTEAFLTFASFNMPQSIYRVDLATGERKLWERPDVPVNPDMITVQQVTYPSKDGTPISMFLVHRKDIQLNGDNPTILYGYGGFNISITPFFSATMFPWFEKGGVYAIPNLRGGGEYGDAWHRAGMLENKQNVFDDFIAAAEWLIAKGYTKPERLGIAGGSNGGLLTGAVVTQRPDLFTAAISAVPLLDMLRYQDFLMAKYWVPEYGSAEDPKQFDFIRKYSPYQNVKPGTKYPAVLFTAGENDSRVHPLHARKMAALMQASTASDQEREPILLWVDRDAGHGQGKPLHLRVRDVADQRIFMMWQTGMLSEGG